MAYKGTSPISVSGNSLFGKYFLFKNRMPCAELDLDWVIQQTCPSRHLRYWSPSDGQVPHPSLHPDVCRSRLQCTSPSKTEYSFVCLRSERPLCVFRLTRKALHPSIHAYPTPLFPIHSIRPAHGPARHVLSTMSRIPDGRRASLWRTPPCCSNGSRKDPCRPQSWTLPHSPQ